MYRHFGGFSEVPSAEQGPAAPRVMDVVILSFSSCSLPEKPLNFLLCLSVFSVIFVLDLSPKREYFIFKKLCEDEILLKTNKTKQNPNQKTKLRSWGLSELNRLCVIERRSRNITLPGHLQTAEPVPVYLQVIHHIPMSIKMDQEDDTWKVPTFLW